GQCAARRRSLAGANERSADKRRGDRRIGCAHESGRSNPGTSLKRLQPFISGIIAQRRLTSAQRAIVVGVSGIDASGKGFITEQIAERLRESGWRVATIHADDWLNLPEVCMSRRSPGEHFYEHAMCFDKMFDQLI